MTRLLRFAAFPDMSQLFFRTSYPIEKSSRIKVREWFLSLVKERS